MVCVRVDTHAVEVLMPKTDARSLAGAFVDSGGVAVSFFGFSIGDSVSANEVKGSSGGLHVFVDFVSVLCGINQ